jgi:hypothetical protein
VGDLLIEPFQLYQGALPSTHAGFVELSRELLQDGMRAAGIEADASGAGDHAVMVETLRLVATDANPTLALRACCYLRLLGAEGRSFEEIGREFGVTRACVQEIYSGIQERHPGMHARGDKKQACREACRARRLGVRKVRTPWRAARLWKAPTILPL